jgi:hypothetical protein
VFEIRYTDKQYQTINDDESPKAGVHFCAGVELMSLRKPQNINTMVGRIFHFMKLELAVRNLCSLGNITGLEPITLSTSPYTMRSFSELLLQAETACLELWAAIHSYSCEKPTEAHLENVEVKVHQALRLEQRLQDFETTLDNAWTYTPVSYSAQEHFITIPVPKEAYIFSGIQLGAQWMALWCAHVRLKDTLAASISASRNTSTHSTVIKRLSNANSGIDKICASMPFMLGELARGDTIPRSCLQVRDVVRVEMRVDEAWEKGVAVPSMVSCASCSAQESFWAIHTSLITIVRGPDKPIPSKTATYLMAVVGWARGLLFQASLCLMLECVCPAKSALTAARCSKMLSWLSST